jgi:Ras-related protein Rab-6A
MSWYQNQYKLKMVILGDSGVGKSCLLTRYVNNLYSEFFTSTIGAAFMTKNIDDKFRVDIWDTAGQERYRSLIPMYLKGAHIILIVLSSDTPLEQMNNQIDYWINYIDNNGNIFTNCKILLVISKIDLNLDVMNLDITFNHIERFFKIVFVSAKTGLNIDQFSSNIYDVCYLLGDIIKPANCKKIEDSNGYVDIVKRNVSYFTGNRCSIL